MSGNDIAIGRVTGIEVGFGKSYGVDKSPIPTSIDSVEESKE